MRVMKKKFSELKESNIAMCTLLFCAKNVNKLRVVKVADCKCDDLEYRPLIFYRFNFYKYKAFFEIYGFNYLRLQQSDELEAIRTRAFQADLFFCLQFAQRP